MAQVEMQICAFPSRARAILTGDGPLLTMTSLHSGDASPRLATGEPCFDGATQNAAATTDLTHGRAGRVSHMTPTAPAGRPLRIGFADLANTNWTAGSIYYKNLFNALRQLDNHDDPN